MARRKKLYHGTTSLFVPEIRSKGLLGRAVNYDYDESRQGSALRKTRGQVFLSTSAAAAAMHASTAADEWGGDPIVIEVAPSQPIYIDPEMEEFIFDAQERGEKLEAYQYFVKGRVPPGNIRSIKPAEYYDEDAF